MPPLKFMCINRKCAFARCISGSRAKEAVLACLSPQEQQETHQGNIMKIRRAFSIKIVHRLIDYTTVGFFPQGDWKNSSIAQTTK